MFVLAAWSSLDFIVSQNSCDPWPWTYFQMGGEPNWKSLHCTPVAIIGKVEPIIQVR